MTSLQTTLRHPAFIGFDRLFDEISSAKNVQSGYPPYNITKESDEHYTIELAVAGYEDDDITITSENGHLNIVGSKGEDSRDYIHKGIAKRNFKQSFRLAEHVVVNEASLDNGILEIRLEKIIPEEKKPKTIPINHKLIKG